MKYIKFTILIIFSINIVNAQSNEDIKKYISILKEHIYADYKGMYKEPGGALEYKFLTPGSSQYSEVLWDWDSWLTNVALRQILLEKGSKKDREEALEYEKGCVLNFLNYGGMNGWTPIVIHRDSPSRVEWMESIGEIYSKNMHKPCLAQHAAFIVKMNGGDAEWLREKFYFLQAFVGAYYNHYRHKPTGLYFWASDNAIGVDNDPSTYYRPPKSSGSIYLNSFMYKELEAMIYLSNQLELTEISKHFEKDKEELLKSIQEHCWDPRDQFFYSVDLNLMDYEEPDRWRTLHMGGPRRWDCVIERLDVWSSFLPLWAGVATQEQAKIVVEKHFRDTTRFNAPYGIRTLSPLEKMYNLRASGNPSSWLGPVWMSANYLVYRSLLNYGFEDEAREMAVESIILLGKDVEKNGAMHEYYLPDSGQPVLNLGFQNWNYLVINMIAWLEGREVIEEF